MRFIRISFSLVVQFYVTGRDTRNSATTGHHGLGLGRSRADYLPGPLTSARNPYIVRVYNKTMLALLEDLCRKCD